MSDFKPFKAHVFVCTNQRENGASCGAQGGAEFRSQLKDKCKALGKGVRINQAGCLDRCEEGIVAVIYPSGRWLTDLKVGDVDKVLETIKSEIAE